MNKILKTFGYVLCLVLISFVFDSNINIFQNRNRQHKLKAICRKDNDFATNNDKKGDAEVVPGNVTITIDKIVDSIKKNFTPPGYTRILGGIYKIRVTPLTSLYVVKIYYEGNYPLYYIIACDAGTDIATNAPPYIFGDCMENDEDGFQPDARLLTHPLISFKDINDDGTEEIMIKERVHNGNVYNAELDHYYDLDDNMTLHEILCIESSCLSAIYDDCTIYRTLNKSTLFDTVKCKYNKPQAIGNVLLQIKLHSKIISEKVEDSLYNGSLITGSGFFISNLGQDSLFIQGR